MACLNTFIVLIIDRFEEHLLFYQKTISIKLGGALYNKSKSLVNVVLHREV